MNRNKGFTLGELLLVVLILGIIAAVAVPSMLRAKHNFEAEERIVDALRAINAAQTMYVAGCGYGYYSPSLSNFGRAPKAGEAFLPPSLSLKDTVVFEDYRFEMEDSTGRAPKSPEACNGWSKGFGSEGYWVTATPVDTSDPELPISGYKKAYGTNTTGDIFWARQGTRLAMTNTEAPKGAIRYIVP